MNELIWGLIIFVLIDLVLMIAVFRWLRRRRRAQPPTSASAYQPQGVSDPHNSSARFSPSGINDPHAAAASSAAALSSAEPLSDDEIPLRHPMIVNAVRAALQRNDAKVQRFYRETDGQVFFLPSGLSDPTQRDQAIRAFRALNDDTDDQVDLGDIMRIMREMYR